jgi:5-methylcytosine-specific restriction protein B
MPEEHQLDLERTYSTIRNAAQEERFVSYGDLAASSDAPWNNARRPMPRHLEQLVVIAKERGWPMLSAIVVNKEDIDTGKLDGSAREGLLSAARSIGIKVGDPEQFVKDQQQKVFAWAKNAPETRGLSQSARAAQKNRGSRFAFYMQPVLEALRSFGGEGQPKQVSDWIRQHHDVPDDELNGTVKHGQTIFDNRVAFARLYLTKAGFLYSPKRGIWALTTQGQETKLSDEEAQALVKELRASLPDEGEAEHAPDLDQIERAATLFDDPNRRFWFAGASWDGDDQTERFVKEGIWQNGYDDKFSELVAQMKPGDLIAIKASFVQRYHLPFDAGDKSVSCMRIKAVGTITERLDDGKTVRVEWDKPDEPRDWYFYTYRTTLVEADREDAHARRLIVFTFGGAKQDYDFWLRQPYWARKYGSNSADAGPDITVEDETAELEGDEAEHPHYGVDNIIEDGCFFPHAFLESALQRLRAKKNVILQGPPGTGKTWLARRLAYALIGSQHRAVAKARMRIVQFHPSLSYEDFVRGWRPQKSGGLALVDGVFLEAIQAAGAEPDRQFVLIIVEINRGNPAQIFGELLTLLEDSKRRPDEAIELAYRREDGERVFIPPNLHVIGTMNVADRSLALVDLALRRRFAFVSLEPQLGDAWRRWCTERCGFDAETIASIEQRLTALNQDISEDRSLGRQYRIGHSYVTPPDGAPGADGGKWFRQVVETEIGPLLEEYWYDAPDKAEQALKRLLTGLPE